MVTFEPEDDGVWGSGLLPSTPDVPDDVSPDWPELAVGLLIVVVVLILVAVWP